MSSGQHVASVDQVAPAVPPVVETLKIFSKYSEYLQYKYSATYIIQGLHPDERCEGKISQLTVLTAEDELGIRGDHTTGPVLQPEYFLMKYL